MRGEYFVCFVLAGKLKERRLVQNCLLFTSCDWLNARLLGMDVASMKGKKFESPVKRLGFVIFCLSSALCLVAFLITYKTYYDIGFYWLAHLIFDGSDQWQQTAFKLGLVGAIVGAALAWDYASVVKRLYKWVSNG